MMSNAKSNLIDRLMELYDQGDEEIKRAMVNLFLMELSEKDLRSYILLFGHGK